MEELSITTPTPSRVVVQWKNSVYQLQLHQGLWCNGRTQYNNSNSVIKSPVLLSPYFTRCSPKTHSRQMAKTCRKKPNAKKLPQFPTIWWGALTFIHTCFEYHQIWLNIVVDYHQLSNITKLKITHWFHEVMFFAISFFFHLKFLSYFCTCYVK
jgi:hypothetical protein